MTTQSNDPLQNLIAENTEDVDRGRLFDVLKDYVVFTKTGEMTFLQAFYKLENQAKLLVVLVAQKARHLLFDDMPEAMSPSELIALDVMAEGSVKSSLKRLLEKTHQVKKDGQKKYYVPNYLLNNLSNELKEE